MAADFLSYVLKGEARVAIIDGAVIGYLIAYPRDDDYFIENIAVDPLAAGKGTDKILIAVVEKSAIEAKKSCIRLYTNIRIWEIFLSMLLWDTVKPTRSKKLNFIEFTLRRIVLKHES